MPTVVARVLRQRWQEWLVLLAALAEVIVAGETRVPGEAAPPIARIAAAGARAAAAPAAFRAAERAEAATPKWNPRHRLRVEAMVVLLVSRAPPSLSICGVWSGVIRNAEHITHLRFRPIRGLPREVVCEFERQGAGLKGEDRLHLGVCK